MKLLLILGCLFLGLVVMVFLAERFGKHQSKESMAAMSRWVMPLVFILLLLQLALHYLWK